MEKPSFKLVGAPCGQHGQYTFYKAIRLSGEKDRIIAIGDFFFVRIWQDSELVSVGELQLLWTDRISDQTLVSLRLYFLPENTPDGRNQHGEDEVLAINDKVVLRAEDLLSWVCSGEGWRWGLRAVWRGACAPPTDLRPTAPLHHTNIDFSDVENEKNAIVDTESPGVVVFSYPRYCRYRALVSRLEGIQGDWLRDSLVAALGGYAAPTHNTRILYCKDTFEYPELEGHEFVCNHLAPKLKGRPRGRRRRAPRAGESPSPSPPSASPEPDSDERSVPSVATPRRLSLRNGAEKQSDEEYDKRAEEDKRDSAEDRSFMATLRQFYRDRNETMHAGHTLKDLSLRALYEAVSSRGGYEAVCRHKLWRVLCSDQPARARRHYERFLLPYEQHSRRNGLARAPRLPPRTVATIDVTGSPPPPRTTPPPAQGHSQEEPKRLRTPSPVRVDNETGETKDDLNLISKPAEELNREFLESLPKDEKPLKITVKPVEKLIDAHTQPESEEKKIDERKMSEANGAMLNELAHKLNLSSPMGPFVAVAPETRVNGHDAPQDQLKSSRPAGRSSLRAVRVKPTRPQHTPANTPPISSMRAESSTSPPQAPPPHHPPPLTNFGIHHPPATNNSHSDDEIVEVPYKPKTPEIIDLDEYPESPQSVKKKKLDILKERGLEVTAIPTWPLQPPIAPLMTPNPILLNPAVQHQIMTRAQIFQMYNIIPPTTYNGAQPPKVIQATSLFGTSGPEKTVYGNPKDPFMPPPHILTGTPVKPQRNIPTTTTPPQDILDLTCKSPVPSQKPAVEIVRIPSAPSPSKVSPQNLSKNYTLIDGKAVVGSNLEITLVNPRSQTPNKNRAPQKRSSNGKFVSSKTPTPPKEHPKQFPSPSGLKKNPIVVPNYQINARDNVSPASSTGSRDSQTNATSVFKPSSLAQILEMQKSVPSVPLMDPVYMSALYNSLGHLDQRQLSMYRDLMANQFRYTGLLNLGVGTPTTKN